MIRSVLFTGLFACASTVFGQGAAPAFEVASIKPAAPQTEGRFMVRMGGDAGRIDYANVSLKQVLTRAYNVKQHQINGPSWLDSERFDITAKIPEDVPREQVPAMLQNLLAERFKMTIHRETKDQPVYALVVGKSGHKLTKAAEGESANFKGPEGAPPPPPPPGAGGFDRTAGGRGGPGGPGGGGRGMIMIGANGRMQASKMTMAGFCDMLSNFLDRPVTNLTDIQGEFDITLEVSPDEMRGLRMMRAMPAGAAPPGHAPGHEAGPAPESAPTASIFSAVQQLGLKLEPRKAPIEFIIVDKAEKVPTEN